MPKLAREVIRPPLAGAGDIEIVGEVDRGEELLTVAAVSAPDVAIVGTRDGELPPAVREALYAQPRLSVVAVGARDGELSVYVLRPRRSRVGAVAPSDLPRVVRSAAGGWRADG